MDPVVLNDNGKRPRGSELDNTTSMGRVTFVDNDIECLRDFRNSLTSEELRNFRKGFGRLDTVLDVTVDEGAVRALIRYYDPKYRCFVFPNVDLTPTLEEFHYLISPTWDEKDKRIYIPDLTKVVSTANSMMPELQKYFGLDHSWIDGTLRKGKQHGEIRWSQIYRNMKAKKGKVRRPIQFLALGIYGLVLFPYEKDRVSSRVMDLVIDMIKNPGRNIMPTILAEIHRSCTYIGVHAKGKLRCCTQLMTLWIHNHFPAKEGLHYHSTWFDTSDLVDDFRGHDKRELDKDGWYNVFTEARTANVTWRVRWLWKVTKYIEPIKNQSWVPLIGVYGAITYAPRMVARQIGDVQEKISLAEVNRYYIEYDQGEAVQKELDDMNRVWKACPLRSINPRGGANESFMKWREEWIKNRPMPRKPKSNLYSELTATKKTLGEAHQQICAMNFKIGDLQRLYNDVKHRADSKQEDLDEIQEKLVKLEVEVTEWKRRALLAEEKVRCKFPKHCSHNLQETKKKLNGEINQLKRIVASQEQELDWMAKELEKTRKLLDKAKRELKEANEKLKAQEKRHSSEIAGVSVQMARLETQLEESRVREAEWKQKCMDFQKEQLSKLTAEDAEIMHKLVFQLSSIKREIRQVKKLDLGQMEQRLRRFPRTLEELDEVNGPKNRDSWLAEEVEKMIASTRATALSYGPFSFEDMEKLWDEIEDHMEEFRVALMAQALLS